MASSPSELMSHVGQRNLLTRHTNIPCAFVVFATRYTCGLFCLHVPLSGVAHQIGLCRYVDYAMHRVRLLRHFKIVPYIVFDGGPLPAKRGTEQERKKKREECLAKANDLAARGRDKQARDYYVKCVDVTPQMAFQFIKVRSSGFLGPQEVVDV